MTKKRDSSTIPNADGVSVACEPAGKRAKAAVPAKPPMRILQWNVNGLRALALKGTTLKDVVAREDPDVICLSEVKCREADNPLKLPGYTCFFHESKLKKGGYAGIAMYSKSKPLDVIRGIGVADDEGRAVAIELEKLCVMCIYVPNSGSKLDRLGYRTTTWDKRLREFVAELSADKKKPIALVGDLNVAHLDIDIHDPIRNRNKSAGFCDSERENFSLLLKECNLVDVWRHKYPHATVEGYTYYSHRFNMRAKQKGWRLDYVLLSDQIIDAVSEIRVLQETGSDHLPLVVDLSF
ncbi:Endonuclease/exonuclease/phosphatase domain-containing protein [Plasmodiophora brassicae]